MFEHILIVCVGNICRSPTAEILFRRRLPTLQVSSAGLQALTGQRMDATAQAVLADHGITSEQPHIACQLNAAMVSSADLVLVMEHAHIRAITQDVPQATGRIMLLGKWQRDTEIPDPYGRGRAAFERTFQLIDAAVEGWLPYLQTGRDASG